MLFNSEKIQESFAYNKRGKLLKDREEVIWSIFQYLDYILQFKEAIVLTILEEKQYKTPLGKHREINPHSAETERKTDFTEFRKNQRGYKGISKYYVIDVEKIALEKNYYTHSNKYKYVFWEKTGLHHMIFLEQQTDDALVGIAEAFCRYLYRYQPLKRTSSKWKDRATIIAIRTIQAFSEKKYGTLKQPSSTEPNKYRKIPDFTKIPNKLLREQIDSFEDEDIVARDLAYDIFLNSKQDKKRILKFLNSTDESMMFNSVYTATQEGHITLGYALDPEREHLLTRPEKNVRKRERVYGKKYK